MADRTFIHSKEDLREFLLFALSESFIIYNTNAHQDKPEPKFVVKSDIEAINGGDFAIIRKDWIFGNFRMRQQIGGRNHQKYAIQGQTNFYSLGAYFQGEQLENEMRRLGNGGLTLRTYWTSELNKRSYDPPDDAKDVYKSFCKHLLSNRVAPGGVHRYWLCKHALRLALSEKTLPPFDYIKWDMEVFEGKKKLK